MKIEPLKRINLITGQNNTGKTGVLEALVLLLDSPLPNHSLRSNLLNLFRVSGGDWNENWKWLFYNKNISKILEIRGCFDNASDFQFILKMGGWSANERPPQPLQNLGAVGHFQAFAVSDRNFAGLNPAIFSTHPSNPTQDAIDYNRVILKRRKKQVEKLLREIEPRLEAVEALQTGQLGQSTTALIYADVGLSEMIPVTQLGQGFNRLLDIYSEIVAADARVLLIDEIENGLHHSVLPVIWKGLFLAAQEFDVQIFATTHSWECILAADEAARAGKNYDLALIRLDRIKDDVTATVIDEKSLSTAKELQWEMR